MKHKVFAYGTLMDPEIRKSIIGKHCKSKNGSLTGYRLDEIILDGNNYPIIIKDSIVKKPLHGVTFKVNDFELKILDRYESNAYVREKVVLQSGEKAWVYVKP